MHRRSLGLSVASESALAAGLVMGMMIVPQISSLSDDIINAVETEDIATSSLPEPQQKMFANGYNPKRSGDILFTFKPGYFDGTAKGTTHGLWNPYDAHIPLVFYGWHIAPGKTNHETYMTDISATVAALLQIQMPSGCVGKVITQVMQER